jgi:hypothetical protein
MKKKGARGEFSLKSGACSTEIGAQIQEEHLRVEQQKFRFFLIGTPFALISLPR